MEVIKYESETIGPRPPGSQEEVKAAEYIDNKFKEYGLESEIREFKEPVWVDKGAELTILKPEEKKIVWERIEPIQYSLPTSPEGITAEIVYVGSGLQPQDFVGRDVKHKIVLFNPG